MENRPWWNPDTSYIGSGLMWAVGVITALIGTQYFQLPYWTACVIASVVAVVVGLVYNFFASLRGAKKIHWLDFLLIDLFPW